MTDKRSGWTLDTLKALMDERDRRYTEVSAAKEEAVKVALANAEKAAMLAETNSQRWRDNANEWRKTLEDREANFLHKNIGIVIGLLSTIAFMLALFEKVAK